jgi:hypothetical protein
VQDKKSRISAVIGSVLATGLSASPIAFAGDSEADNSKASNPFVMQSLNERYAVAYADRVDPSKYGAGAKAAEGNCGMSLADKNKDNKVTKEEFIKHHEGIFDKIDANKDGAVDPAEADSFAKSRSGGGTAAPHGQMKK